MSGSRLRLGTRLALQLFLVAGGVAALTAATALVLVERSLHDRQINELEATRESALAGVRSAGDALPSALAGVERRLTTVTPDVLEQLALGRLDSSGAGELLARSAGLDTLEITDGTGRILSSTESRVGLEDPSLPSLSGIELRYAEDGLPGFRTRRVFRVGSRELHLVGGQKIDPATLIGGRADVAALLFRGPGRAPIPLNRGAELPPDPTRRLSADVDGSTARISDGTRGWLATTYALEGAQPDERGAVVLALDDGAMDELLARMRRSLLALGAAVSLLAAAAGLWIGRSISQPVRDLVRTVDEIAAGEADYTFPTQARHELDELVASFSRLHRSLERQRERSRAAERVAAWREVARHVAHEVKNPLAPIRLTVENLRRARSKAPERFDALFDEGTGTILEEVDQLSRLVSEFSEFARLPLPQRTEVELEPLLDAVLDLHAAEPNLEIRRDYGASRHRHSLDPDQFSRALKNIVGNAVEAMQSGPEGAERSLEVRTRDDGNGVRIEISDSGPGLSSEAAQRIFEPYFTTKGTGTGLGMALTYRIIVEHGGLIEAENLAATGARIVIRLPVAGEAESRP